MSLSIAMRVLTTLVGLKLQKSLQHLPCFLPNSLIPQGRQPMYGVLSDLATSASQSPGPLVDHGKPRILGL